MIAAKVSLLIAIAIPTYDSVPKSFWWHRHLAGAAHRLEASAPKGGRRDARPTVDQEQSSGRRAIAPTLQHEVSPVGG
ncbi:MAG: hypothetical protein L6277_11380 [Desulfobacterales bacterium]|nr:hypothetical protein [Pseudomonadota bacterium]MCG2772673.1 hypothetical protein [Desulfobacterales bacterium]